MSTPLEVAAGARAGHVSAKPAWLQSAAGAVRVTVDPVQAFLRRDHERLARLLDAACRGDSIDALAFQPFRAGLLRHIGMEEKLLLPALKQVCGAEVLSFARQMKLDHSALAALLVPTPTREIVARLRALLEIHNAMEEGDGGVYDRCERLAPAARDDLLAALNAAREVKLAPYQDGPRAMASIERLLRAAKR